MSTGVGHPCQRSPARLRWETRAVAARRQSRPGDLRRLSMATTFSRWADACVPVWRTEELRVDGQVLHVGDQAGRVGVSFFHPVAGAVGSVGNPVGLSKWCGQAGSTTGELRISVEPGCPHHGTVHSPSCLAENKVSAQVRGVTPLPAVASASLRDGPSVTMRWAWWRSRSTAAVARVLGMMVSKPAGWRLLVTATLRLS